MPSLTSSLQTQSQHSSVASMECDGLNVLSAPKSARFDMPASKASWHIKLTFLSLEL